MVSLQEEMAHGLPQARVVAIWMVASVQEKSGRAVDADLEAGTDVEFDARKLCGILHLGEERFAIQPNGSGVVGHIFTTKVPLMFHQFVIHRPERAKYTCSFHGNGGAFRMGMNADQREMPHYEAEIFGEFG